MEAAAGQLVQSPGSTLARGPRSGRHRMMRQYDLIERVRGYNPHTDEPLLNRAYVYAMKAHGEQVRASGDPYFSHPLEVAAILTDLKLDDATIAAALLHDGLGPSAPLVNVVSTEDAAAVRFEAAGNLPAIFPWGPVTTVPLHATALMARDRFMP